jgi:hypothetical protein
MVLESYLTERKLSMAGNSNGWVIYDNLKQQKTILESNLHTMTSYIFMEMHDEAPMHFASMLYDLVHVGATERAAHLVEIVLQLFQPGILAEDAVCLVELLLATHEQTAEEIAAFKAFMAAHGCDLDSPPEKSGVWTFFPQPKKTKIYFQTLWISIWRVFLFLMCWFDWFP